MNETLKEIKEHAPVTFAGAVFGIMLFMVFKNLPTSLSKDIFNTIHPLHVLFSAFATSSMYKIYTKKTNIVHLIIIGYLGSVGIATLSDCIIPYIGEILLNMPNADMHLGFIEKWWLVNPLALIGILIASYKPSTQLPHMAHVLLSTLASLFHILMATGNEVSVWMGISILFFLFIAVWIPCCVSDIVFPLMFVRDKCQKS